MLFARQVEFFFN